MSENTLEVRGLRKRFGTLDAVDGIELSIRRGEFYALLGPNGAGKTTTLRMITGLLRPDAGSIRVLGQDLAADPAAAKQQMAFLPDDPMLYGLLRPMEYLEFVAGLWGLDGKSAGVRAQELLEWLDLWKARDDYASNFSRGMKQKLALAGALIHEPRLMILDEPLTGLDASAARQVKDLLQSRVRDGMTVVLTTHILEVAERLSERIGIISRGRLIAEGSLDELRARSKQQGTLEDVFLNLISDDSSGVPA